MNPQLHETTLSLISLIYFYKQISKNNEKINYAIDSSQLMTMQSIEASSEEKKQQFCSDAVEAITSVVIESHAKSIDINNVESLLNKEEVDFIQDLTFNDVRQKFDSESDVIDIQN
jgi:DNA-binding protein YbaB